MNLKDSWYEKLQRWDEALAAYEQRMASVTPGSAAFTEALLGRLRCLAALGEWEELSSLCREAWAQVEPYVRRDLAMLGAYASWNIGRWDEMAEYTGAIKPRAGSQDASATGLFLSAIINAKERNFAEALSLVEGARDALVTDLAALVGESYERAYGDMVRVQQLSELEECIEYMTLAVSLQQLRLRHLIPCPSGFLRGLGDALRAAADRPFCGGGRSWITWEIVDRQARCRSRRNPPTREQKSAGRPSACSGGTERPGCSATWTCGSRSCLCARSS